MQWSDCLAEVAYEYLEKCHGFGNNLDRQRQAAAKNCEASDQAVGENIYKSSGLITDYNVVTTAWASEKSNFDYTTLQCSGVCEHYKQMV